MQIIIAALSLVSLSALAGCCSHRQRATALSPPVSGCIVGAPDARVELSQRGLVASALSSERYQRPGCAARFVVEAQAALGRSYAVVASWGEPLPRDEQACASAIVDVEVFGHALRFDSSAAAARRRSPGALGAGYRLVWKRIGGALLAGSFARGRCELVAVRGELPLVERSIYASVRVAVRAAAVPHRTRFVRALAGVLPRGDARIVSTSSSDRSACRRTSDTRSACGSPRAAPAADLR